LFGTAIYCFIFILSRQNTFGSGDEICRFIRPEDMTISPKPLPSNGGKVNLKMLAEYLDLSPATISFVLNDAPGRSIPQVTRERVREAAKKFGYQPSQIARSLQGRRTRTIGVLTPEIGEGYHAQVMSGIGDLLMENQYFYFTAHHRHRKDLIAEYPRMLQARGIDGIVAIDTQLPEDMGIPAVTIASHTSLAGVTNVLLDHQRAAELSVTHLYELGHRRISFMQGPPLSSDTRTRWRSTLRVARAMGLIVEEELIIRLDSDSTTPELGYPGVRDLLLRRPQFTAMLCFNDISAIGSIRALHEAGLRVPGDVSVMGFDDIASAAYQVPSLTTIRQPLHRMGYEAAAILLKKLAGEHTANLVHIEPELVARESTARVCAG
jgi:DNA-binding LacI/PurR family transcriptional regulator